jgi:hypothetical protein
MTAITFDPCFVFRTKSIIEEYDWKKEFTLLLNCLVGLIIFIHEKKYQLIGNSDFLNQKIRSIPEFEFLHEKPFNNRQLSTFLKRFRNWIAHINIIANNNSWKRISIKIWDNHSDSIILTYDQVKTIALYITNKYLESFSKDELKCN